MKVSKVALLNRYVSRRALVSVAALAVCGTSLNAHAADATGTADATVVKPISIASAGALNFGSFSTAAAGDTVIVAPGGGRTFGGSALGVNSVNTPSAASFTVTGEGSLTYAITLPGSAVTLTHKTATGAGTTMQVGTFTSNPNGTGTLSAGTQTLNVGATLTTVASQVVGAYTGSFTVSVNYN